MRVNNKVYTHEFIDIRGAKRPQYMHHMTANWSPIAQEERNQLCFGVWGVIGTTDRWPRVINMWEEDGFAGLAAGLGHETGGRTCRTRSWRSGGTRRRITAAAGSTAS